MRKHILILATVAGFLHGGRQQWQQVHKKRFYTRYCSGTSTPASGVPPLYCIRALEKAKADFPADVY